MTPSLRIRSVVFISSLAVLAFEITLTRVFCIALWYHFAFMVISIAMLGIGASGTVLSLVPRLGDLSRLGIYSLLLGTAITVGYLAVNQAVIDPVELSWSAKPLLAVPFYYCVLSLPFFFTGLIIATAFKAFSQASATVYATDLIGAGSGSVVALALLSIMGPDRAIFAVAAISLLGALLSGSRPARTAAALLLAADIILLVLLPPFARLSISPHKGLPAAMRHPGAKHINTYYSPFSVIDTFESPAVRFAPGLSLRYLNPLPEQIGLAIDGGEVSAVTAITSRKALDFVRFLPSALPYEMADPADVLVLEPKGGLQTIIAQLYGALAITAVESNPLIVSILKGDLAGFTSNAFRDGVRTGMGRSWLSVTSDSFDIIDLSLLQPTPAGSFGISEDYRYTVEAFREYLRHLKPNGMLSVNTFILPPPRTELRILATVIAAMEDLGWTDTAPQLIVLRSWATICILAKRTPFSSDETALAKDFADSRRFDLLHLPGGRDNQEPYVKMTTQDYPLAFKSIIDPHQRTAFINRYLYDIHPVHDDSPFFHHYLKLRNIPALLSAAGGKWQYFIEEGYLLPAAFLQVLLLSIAIIVLPVLSQKTRPPFRITGQLCGMFPVVSGNAPRALPPCLTWPLLYFASIGVGFMFSEIVFIQSAILPLENPPYAMATVVTGMLISAGIGSMLSRMVAVLRRRHVLIVIALLIVAVNLTLPHTFEALQRLSLALRVTAVFVLFLPAGLLMGVPLPLGMQALGAYDASLIPWAWAVNGCMSVLAPFVAMMLAQTAGFSIVLWLGAVAYAVAFLASRRFGMV